MANGHKHGLATDCTVVTNRDFGASKKPDASVDKTIAANPYFVAI
jgi:hypothetical protein